MKRFTYLFLLAAWLNFFASDEGIIPSAFLMFAGAYAMADIIPEVWRKFHD